MITHCNGIMGVPITYFASPSDYFEVLDSATRGTSSYTYRTKMYTRDDFDNYSDLNVAACLLEDGRPRPRYFRNLIRRKTYA